MSNSQDGGPTAHTSGRFRIPRLWSRLPPVLRSGAVYAASGALVNGTRLLLLPIYARFLTADEYGTYVTLTTIVSFSAMFATMGLDTAITRAYYAPGMTARDYGSLVRRLLLFLAVTNAIWLATAGICLQLALPGLLGKNGSLLVPWLPVAMVIAWLYPHSAVLLAATQAQRLAWRYGTVQVLRAVSVVGGATLLLAVWHTGITGALTAEGAGALLVALLLLPTMGRKLVAPPTTPPLSAAAEPPGRHPTDIRSSLRFGLPLIPHALATWTLAVSDRLVLARFVSPGELGIYAMGYTIAMGLSFLLTAANTAYVPHFFGYASDPRRRDLTRDAALYAVIGGWLVVTLALLAPELLALVTTERYVASAPTLRLIAFAYYVLGFYLLSVLPLFHLNATQWLPLISGGAAAVNVVSNLIFVPRFGITAAAVNTIAAYGVLFVGVEIVRRRIYPRRVLGPAALVAGAATLAAALLGGAISFPVRCILVVVLGIPAVLHARSVIHSHPTDAE